MNATKAAAHRAGALFFLFLIVGLVNMFGFPRFIVPGDATADGEAKFWIEPSVELAESHRFRKPDLARIDELIRDHENDIRDTWNRHFGR